MKISGNGWIVTGGLGGVGKACAINILKEGGHVALFDVIAQDKGEALTQEIDAKRASYFRTDISDPKSVETSVAAAVTKFGSIKVVGGIHCAGIALRREWTNKMSDSIPDMIKMLNVNALGTFIVDAYVADAINANYPDEGRLPPRTKEERGVIINFASAAASPYARVLCYGPTKTFVLGVTTSASDYLGPSGIRVNAVSPSIVATGMAGPHLPYFESELESGATFPRRQADLQEIWSGVKFLIENEMLNGHDLKVDGGWRLVSNWAPGEPDPRAKAPGLE
ncbi:NAD(P)-binding protein [Meredithblackwellia eburnea MCA 4105]